MPRNSSTHSLIDVGELPTVNLWQGQNSLPQEEGSKKKNNEINSNKFSKNNKI